MKKYARDKDNIRYLTDYEIKLAEENRQHYLSPASYYIVENVFNKSELKDLNELLTKREKDLVKGSVVGKSADESIEYSHRNSDVLFLDDNVELDKYEKKIVDVVKKVNDNVYNFDLTSYMHPQYTIYKEDMYFDWHPDGPLALMDSRGMNLVPEYLEWRKLSAVLSLTDEKKYVGGDFQIFNLSCNPYDCLHTLRLDAGSMILFPAFIQHKVTKVDLGTRKTLVYWFCGPRWR